MGPKFEREQSLHKPVPSQWRYFLNQCFYHARVASQHYLEAANLAPGHKVIWNSPPLRRYGNVQPESESEASESGNGHSH